MPPAWKIAARLQKPLGIHQQAQPLAVLMFEEVLDVREVMHGGGAV